PYAAPRGRRTLAGTRRGRTRVGPVRDEGGGGERHPYRPVGPRRPRRRRRAGRTGPRPAGGGRARGRLPDPGDPPADGGGVRRLGGRPHRGRDVGDGPLGRQLGPQRPAGAGRRGPDHPHPGPAALRLRPPLRPGGTLPGGVTPGRPPAPPPGARPRPFRPPAPLRPPDPPARRRPVRTPSVYLSVHPSGTGRRRRRDGIRRAAVRGRGRGTAGPVRRRTRAKTVRRPSP